jgi:hypothetical protein
MTRGGQHVHRVLRPSAAAGLQDFRTAVLSARNQNCDFYRGSTCRFLQQRSKGVMRNLRVVEASNAEHSFTFSSHEQATFVAKIDPILPSFSPNPAKHADRRVSIRNRQSFPLSAS